MWAVLNMFDPRNDTVLSSVRIGMDSMNLVTVISRYMWVLPKPAAPSDYVMGSCYLVFAEVSWLLPRICLFTKHHQSRRHARQGTAVFRRRRAIQHTILVILLILS